MRVRAGRCAALYARQNRHESPWITQDATGRLAWQYNLHTQHAITVTRCGYGWHTVSLVIMAHHPSDCTGCDGLDSIPRPAVSAENTVAQRTGSSLQQPNVRMRISSHISFRLFGSIGRVFHACLASGGSRHLCPPGRHRLFAFRNRNPSVRHRWRCILKQNWIIQTTACCCLRPQRHRVRSLHCPYSKHLAMGCIPARCKWGFGDDTSCNASSCHGGTIGVGRCRFSSSIQFRPHLWIHLGRYHTIPHL
jgi:hypothetical protein